MTSQAAVRVDDIADRRLLQDIEANAAECPGLAELTRSIRSFAGTCLASESHSVIGVMSSRPREGRTTISVSLASALVDIYERVLLLETSESHFFSVGLPDVQARDLDCRQPRATVQQGLWYLSATQMRDSAGSLKTIAWLRTLLSELRPQFDVILIDLPPFLSSEEGPALASDADGLVLVVEAGKTDVCDVERAVQLANGKPIRGIILNKAKYLTPRWLTSLVSPGSRSGR